MADDKTGAASEGKAPIAGILEKVKEAEAKARAMVKEAEAQKEKSISEAKREAIEIREKSTKDTDEHIDRMFRESESVIQAERERIFASAENSANKVRAKANSKLGQAQELLIQDFKRSVDEA